MDLSLQSDLKSELQPDLQEDLIALWIQVTNQVAGDGPNKAVLQLAKPLGLLKVPELQIYWLQLQILL